MSFSQIRFRRVLPALVFFCVSVLFFSGCMTMREARKGFSDLVTPLDVTLIRHHVREFRGALIDFTKRLYAKNPRYESNLEIRQQKIRQIFHGGPPVEYQFAGRFSHEVLTAAFQEDIPYPDRVYLLSLGLWKSIAEAYNVKGDELFVSGLQLPLTQLQRLHHNISQVNWRMKTQRDAAGKLFFLSNECGEDGYQNMGYEVIITEILTRIEDDIFLRGGLPEKYLFNMSTFFMSIII